MMYDPKTQLQLVQQRHDELRQVAGRGRLFGRRGRFNRSTADAASRPATTIAPTPDQQAPALPLRLA